MKNITFRKVEHNFLYYIYNKKIEIIDLEKCKINWQNHVNGSSEFTKTDYVSQNCIGYIDSSSSPMVIRIFGNDILTICVKSKLDKIQQWIFKFRKSSYKKLSKIKMHFAKAGWKLYDYS